MLVVAEAVFSSADQWRMCDWESNATFKQLSLHTHSLTRDLERNTLKKRNKWLSDILPLALCSILESGLNGNERLELRFV